MTGRCVVCYGDSIDIVTTYWLVPKMHQVYEMSILVHTHILESMIPNVSGGRATVIFDAEI